MQNVFNHKDNSIDIGGKCDRNNGYFHKINITPLMVG